MVIEVFVEQVTFEQRPEGGGSVSSAKLRAEHIRQKEEPVQRPCGGRD